MKNKTIFYLLVICIICLSACARNFGVLRMGNNKYQVMTNATWEFGGVDGARRMAVEEATKHCASLNKQFETIGFSSSYGHYEGGTVTLAFSCE